MTGWPARVRLAILFAASAVAGWVCERLGAPLPWMIGPLVLTAIFFMSATPRFTVPARLRPLGQIVVATQVGTAFSPAAIDMLLDYAPVIVGTALATGACIFLVAVIMARLTGQGLAQAFLSAMPTSPVEAAAMATAAGIGPMPVILSQTLRLAAVVLVLPFALYAIEGWPDVQRQPVSFALPLSGNLLFLVGIGVASAWVFRALRLSNPNFLGPMTAAAVLAASGYGPEPYPPLVLALAQVVLGTWLGGTFRREIVSSAWRLTVTSLVSAMLTLAFCTLSAVTIAALSGLDWKTLVLGAAPGGVVEMALTARFLEQDIVLVTTFHLIRIFIFMPNLAWIVRLIVRHEARHRQKGASP